MSDEENVPYTVEAIVNHKPKFKKTKNGKVPVTRADLKKSGYYETKWLGYDSDENTWEKAKKMEETVAFTISKYWQKLADDSLENHEIPTTKEEEEKLFEKAVEESMRTKSRDEEETSQIEIAMQESIYAHVQSNRSSNNNNESSSSSKKTPKISKPPPEQSKSSKLTPAIDKLSLNSRKRKINIETSSDEESSQAPQMPVIESVISEDPSKPHKSPETPENAVIQNDKLNNSQKLSKEHYKNLMTEKPVRRLLRKRISFKVSLPSGKAVDGNDIKRIDLDNLKITKFGEFLPQGKRNKYKRFGFVISYKDKRSGHLFLPTHPLRTKNMSDEDYDNALANLMMVQHFLKEKIKEFIDKLPKNI